MDRDKKLELAVRSAAFTETNALCCGDASRWKTDHEMCSVIFPGTVLSVLVKVFLQQNSGRCTQIKTFLKHKKKTKQKKKRKRYNKA